MCTKTLKDEPPRDFEPYEFYIESIPDEPMTIFNIDPFYMFRAGKEAGFNCITSVKQYCDPDYTDHPILRKYLDSYRHNDYVMKFKMRS